jgi:hypothetical protein
MKQAENFSIENLQVYTERALTCRALEHFQRRYYPAATIEEIRDLIIAKRTLKELKKCLRAKSKGLVYKVPEMKRPARQR